MLKDDITTDNELNKLLKGKTGADIEKYSQQIEDRKNELTDRFRKGAVTEDYYKERMKQLNDKDFNSPVPPMFRIDKMPKLQEWAKQNGIDDLPKDDQQLAYDLAKDRAQKDKEMFLKRRYLKSLGLDKTTVYTLEETNPELKGLDKIVSEKVTKVSKEDMQKAFDAEKTKSQEKNKEIGEKIHIDLGDKKEIKTNMVKDNSKTKNLEKDVKNIN